jgi:ubiquinone/menaquinone biosynthesis C-methylase UbiE
MEFESIYEKSDDPWSHQLRVSLQEYDRRYLRILSEYVTAPRRILEIACGTGYFSIKLADSYKDSVIDACDISSQAIQIAKKRYGTGIRFYVDSMPALANTDQQYDLVVLNEALNYLGTRERKQALLRINELLKSRGYFFLSSNIGKNYFQKNELYSLASTVGNIIYTENNYHLLHYKMIELPMLKALSILKTVHTKYPRLKIFVRLLDWILKFLLNNRLLFLMLQQATRRFLGERGVTNAYILVVKNG